MKAKNTIGKIYVRTMPIQDVMKHFIEAFKLKFVEQIGTKLSKFYLSYSSFHRLNPLILKDLTPFITPPRLN